MRISHLLAIAFMLLACAGCSVFEPLPVSDPNVGGGQIGPANPGSGSDADTGSGIVSPENRSPTSPRPGESGAPTVDLPMVKPGEAVRVGDLTFTIGLLQITQDQVFLEYTVEGLDANYQPLDEPIPPAILLPDGRLIPPIRDEGSGSPGSETVQAVFPAIPTTTDIFLLLVENRWNGEVHTWRIPVSTDR